MYTIFLLV